MKKHVQKLGLVLLLGALATPAFADRDRGCSIRDVAGRWVFATGIGEIGPPANDRITAIGTMNISRDGSIEGRFDATIYDDVFLPAITYWGSIVVNRDCTGTVEFTTPISSRTDSIVVVNRGEMIGMSQDVLNVWTYQVRRIGKSRYFDRDDD